MRAVLAGLVAALAVSGPAAAHGADAPDATDYRVTVTGQPAVPGVTVRTVEAGARLELRNHGDQPVEVLGYAGEPYLEIRPDGVWQNVRSPATYRNETLAGDGPVPADADPAAPPQWGRIATEPVARWHDVRTHWLSAGLPAAARADPTRTHRIRDWTVPLRQGTTPFAVTGTLDWVPAPTPGGWWAATLLLAAAVTALTRLRGRVAGVAVAAVAVSGGLTALGYATGRQLDAGTGIGRLLIDQPWTTLAGLGAVVAGLWAVRRRSDFGLGLAGAGLAVFAGLADLGVFSRAVVPVPGPGWWARLALVVVIGTGAGLAAGTVLRLRAALPGRSRGSTPLRLPPAS
jgi:hypothetical protein